MMMSQVMLMTGLVMMAMAGLVTTSLVIMRTVSDLVMLGLVMMAMADLMTTGLVMGIAATTGMIIAVTMGMMIAATTGVMVEMIGSCQI
jgi:hypothetical protein